MDEGSVPEEQQMKLTVFAATGRIGGHILEQALAAGHDVTAVARNPGALPDGVRPVAAAPGPALRAHAGIPSKGTRAIVQAMQATGARRVVVVSAAPVATVASPGRPNPPRHDPGDGFLMRHLVAPALVAALRDVYDDLALMEDVLRDSGLDWTAVRPPRLTNRPLTGICRTAIGRNLRHG